MKKAIKSVLHRLGYELHRYVPGLPWGYMPPRESQLDVMALAIQYTLEKERDKFYFVQIGAMDGTTADPLFDLVCKHKLRGLLVEPLPDNYRRLIENYSSQAQLSFENVAITKYNGEVEFYFIDRSHLEHRNTQSVSLDVQGLSTTVEKNIRATAKSFGLEPLIVKTLVPSLTLASLLEKHMIQSVTLLQIDAEGLDYELIKLAFEAEIYPAMINFEVLGLSDEDRISAINLLALNGYRMSGDNSNVFAMRFMD